MDGKKVEKYTGGRSIDDLKSYVEKSAGTRAKREAAVEEEQKKTFNEVEGSAVLQLTTNNFADSIEKGVTFVKFFAPWLVHTL